MSSEEEEENIENMLKMDKTSEIIKHPFAFELTVPHQRLIGLKKSHKTLKSHSFKPANFPGVDYSFAIAPHPHFDTHEAMIYFDISNKELLNIMTDITFSVEHAEFVENFKYISAEDSDRIEVELCTTEELFDPKKKFIVDGKLTVKINGVLAFAVKGYNKDIVKLDDSKLGVALWNQEKKDFVFNVEDKEIMAHKNVLAARSPVFARMFETEMNEKQESKASIKDFSFDIVEAGIKSCYHHTLAPVMAFEKKLLLLQFYDKYDIQHLKTKLETYLITVINEFTVCRLVNASLLSNSLKLKEKCSKFLRKCLNVNPVSDLDILDKEFALNLFKNSFNHVINFDIFDIGVNEKETENDIG